MMRTADPERLPDLDALRGLAALAVLLYHLSEQLPPSVASSALWLRYITADGQCGALGVRFFFLLSGFLITHRLLRHQGRFDLRAYVRFLVRRASRIWPLYFVSLLLIYKALPSLHAALGRPLGPLSDPWPFLLFMGDRYMASGINPVPDALGVHWSISVEVQFYILWPLTFLFIGGGKRAMAITILLILLSTFHVYHASSHDAYFLFLPNLRYLAAGALLMLLVHAYGRSIAERLSVLPAWSCPAALLVGALILPLFHLWANDRPAWSALAEVYSDIYSCALLVERAHASSGWRLERIPFLNRIGQWSYGIYLLHMVSIAIVPLIVPGPWFLHWAFVLSLTLLLAAFSDRFLERPFLLWSARYNIAPQPSVEN